MNNNELNVLDFLKTMGCFVSPTQIGKIVGGNGRHSSWASPICKRLVLKGLAERDNRGWYRAIPQTNN